MQRVIADSQRFASCQSALLRLPVSSHDLSKALFGAGIGDRDDEMLKIERRVYLEG